MAELLGIKTQKIRWSRLMLADHSLTKVTSYSDQSCRLTPRYHTVTHVSPISGSFKASPLQFTSKPGGCAFQAHSKHVEKVHEDCWGWVKQAQILGTQLEAFLGCGIILFAAGY